MLYDVLQKKKAFHYLINSNKTQILIVIDLLQNAHLLQSRFPKSFVAKKETRRERI